MDGLVRLLVAAGLAALIGVDRELRSKPAGLRTNIVVAVAAAAFAYVGAEVFAGGDPTRVASQVVSGIGFLGGGAIFAAGGKPHGLTTAAALWGSAAIGIASGTGAHEVSVSIVLVTLVALWPLDWLSNRVLAKHGRREARLMLVLDDYRQLDRFHDTLSEVRLQVREIEIRELGDGILVETVCAGPGKALQQVREQLVERGVGVLVTDHGDRRR